MRINWIEIQIFTHTKWSQDGVLWTAARNIRTPNDIRMSLLFFDSKIGFLLKPTRKKVQINYLIFVNNITSLKSDR